MLYRWRTLFHSTHSPYVYTRWVFLRLLGVIYLIAFGSLNSQITGLIGQNGLLPASRFLDLVAQNMGPERYWLLPTLGWLNSSDAFLQFLCLAGMGLALLLIVGILTLPALILLWGLYLSLVSLGQDFLAFQWDILLLETGFLAIFLAPHRVFPGLTREPAPAPILIWLFRWLIFRLMFESGVVKLLSGDPTWRNLTALTYHYETQPLPTPLAWYAHQLPRGFHKISVLAVFLIELVVPFFIFGPRRWRILAAGSFTALQLLIFLTGNYTFFNLLTIVLCIPLLDDAVLRRFLPNALPTLRYSTPGKKWTAGIHGALALGIGVISLIHLAGFTPWRQHLPRTAIQLQRLVAPWHVVNRYGLFAVMTTTRPEIILEGSTDGVNWQAYEFKYKPGDVQRRPPWVAPHQPRLDWQMWFAALSSPQSNPWFANLAFHLTQGTPEVLALLQTNPFPDKPPRFVRAQLYRYKFTDFTTRQETGAWWQRQLVGLYFPRPPL